MTDEQRVKLKREAVIRKITIELNRHLQEIELFDFIRSNNLATADDIMYVTSKNEAENLSDMLVTARTANEFMLDEYLRINFS